MGIDKVLLTTYSTGMTNKQFQRTVSVDMNTLVRLQRERERREICWICGGTGREFVGNEKCVYCAGIGSIHVERGHETNDQ